MISLAAGEENKGDKWGGRGLLPLSLYLLIFCSGYIVRTKNFIKIVDNSQIFSALHSEVLIIFYTPALQ